MIKNANRPALEILIGDDAFLMPVEAMMIQDRYLEPLRDKLTTYDVNFSYASKPEELIKEAQAAKKYDVIVTDLDYQTQGRAGTEGFAIIDQINSMPLSKKPHLILCTSSDDQLPHIQKRLDEGKIDKYVGGQYGNHKFTNLVNYLVQMFQEE